VENSELCVRAQKEIFEAGNLDLADEIVAPDFVDHEAPPGTPRGPEAVKRVAAWLRSALGDLRYEVEDVFESGDRVAVRSTCHGVHVGELFGHAPTGRSFSSGQIHLFRVENGRIAEHWAKRDDVGMMRQLGLIP
jgi:predicted ester cyclase